MDLSISKRHNNKVLLIATSLRQVPSVKVFKGSTERIDTCPSSPSPAESPWSSLQEDCQSQKPKLFCFGAKRTTTHCGARQWALAQWREQFCGQSTLLLQPLCPDSWPCQLPLLVLPFAHWSKCKEAEETRVGVMEKVEDEKNAFGCCKEWSGHKASNPRNTFDAGGGGRV